MDPHSFIARAEAQRWIGIAEKLLLGHDLVGSKTFAIRARESDPRLEAADQILAIIDTLLAAEKRVVGNNGTQQPDYYAILQLVQFVQDTDHIADQYQRLAVLLNPHQNRFSYSDQAFQLVNDAWAVLSNPMRKSMYDSDLDFRPQQQMNPIGLNLEQDHQQQQHQHNFFSINHIGSGSGHDQEPQQSFQTRAQRNHQQQQHNFLSQNPVRAVPVREQEQLFQHHEQEQLFQPQAQPFQATSPPPQQPIQPLTSPPPPPAAPPQPPLSWPQPQRFHPQPESQSQQEEALEQNTDNVQLPSHVTNNNDAREEETEAETDATTDNVDDSPTFWTSCPYCFYMYEYPRVYAECTLRCHNCKRAFQAVRIPSPPSIIEGQDAYFYCWGYFPLGISMSHLQKSNSNGTSRNSNWTPFSPLYDVSSNLLNHLNGRAVPKKKSIVNKSLGPRIYIDDVTDDIFTGISESEPSDDSDLEWKGTRRKK